MPVAQRNAGFETWPRLSDRLKAGAALILPVGSFEQHGPHLPLATDTIIVEALAAAIAEDLDAIVLPALPYGAPSRPRSGGGDLFPTPALPLETLLAAVSALGREALREGCRRLLVLSWHWENAAVLWDALQRVFADSAARALLFDNPPDFLSGPDRDALFPEGFPGWESEHAGRLETALMLYLRPDLVGTPEPPAPFAKRRFDVLPTPADAAPTNGIFFEAGSVTSEVGERCFQRVVSGVSAAAREEFR